MGLGLRVLLAINDSMAQPGSTPECSASVNKNHNTIYTTPESGEVDAHRVRVALGCDSPALRVIACSTTGSRIRACAPVCRKLKPSQTCERRKRGRVQCRTWTGRWIDDVHSHRDRLSFCVCLHTQRCHDPGLTRSDPDPSSSDPTLTIRVRSCDILLYAESPAALKVIQASCSCAKY